MGKERTVAQLRRKLALLVEHQHCADLTAIADALGTKRKTMESWADTGADKATPGLIPSKQYPNVIALFGKAINRNHGATDIEAIVQGSVSDLEQWLKPPPSLGISQLIERDADFCAGRLFVEKSKPIGAVSLRSEMKPATKHVVSTSDWFRLEITSALKSGYLIGIQQCRRQWAFCPIDRAFDKTSILIPGFDEAGQLDWIQENEWIGPNRFIAIEMQSPWPSDICVSSKNGMPLDAQLLKRVAEFYESHPSDSRYIWAINVRVHTA